MGNKMEQCSLASTGIAGPFQSSGYNNCHKGADCWKQHGGAIYDDCGGNGCHCRGGGYGSGTLYVKASDSNTESRIAETEVQRDGAAVSYNLDELRRTNTLLKE